MKILHWAIILLAIILPVSIVCRLLVTSRFNALKDEVRINNAIDTATKDAIDQIIVVSDLMEYDNQFGGVINITPALAQESIDTFFHTMAVNYNLAYTSKENNSDSSLIKSYFASYIPAVIVIAYDGFYTYSLENNGNSGYRYQLSTKIPFTYTPPGANYTIGYTLGDDIYLYPHGSNVCYSGKIYYSDLEVIEEQYNHYSNDYLATDASSISNISDEIQVIAYAMQEQAVGGLMNLKGYVLPSGDNFLDDYSKDENGNITVGDFHKHRRAAIIKIITDVLTEEINEHNTYSDTMGITYRFTLPEITNDEWINTINDISVLAFVQGIPIGTTKGIYYNNFALGGSQIVNSEMLYGDLYHNDLTGKETRLYHRANCKYLKEKHGENLSSLQKFPTREAAISRGYIACQLCN